MQGPVTAPVRLPSTSDKRAQDAANDQRLAVGDESPPTWSVLDGAVVMGKQPHSATSSVRFEVCAADALMTCLPASTVPDPGYPSNMLLT